MWPIEPRPCTHFYLVNVATKNPEILKAWSETQQYVKHTQNIMQYIWQGFYPRRNECVYVCVCVGGRGKGGWGEGEGGGGEGGRGGILP